ncbi:probable serine/threonine-protein kinase At1g54610 isoform X2 [Tripterygium wilfordii]|uniref:probable serine/threonine-protein kinase At1g54610 isoform X2 n=1 Tax=Tripterygium wilfordii TaxID=458696 RepID=UPI0018F81743|nr:probable serine/threonine-protein kinase At1g54610 isoform X2 [Tripterygium wilfordii]
MGCISSKADRESPNERRVSRKGSIDRRVAHVSSGKREEVGRSKDRLDSAEAKIMLIDKKTTGSNRYFADQVGKKKEENCEATTICHQSLGRVPKSIEGEQVAAGWPSWLASVAGEAINGLVPRRATTFEKLEKIGQGTYSCVYKARDITNDKIVALKKVRFDIHDLESVKFMAREIIILRRLDHPNIIKLEGLITSQISSSLYLVFEYMEHDLTGLASIPGMKFTEPQVKCYMQQLLSGLDHCHRHGILHRDIKGSNLLIDGNGILKIADFGLASFFDPHNSVPLTSRVVTLWYRPPELLLGASKYGVAVDLWSTGCILGELYAAKPILPGKTEVEQLHKIFKLCGSPSEDYWRTSKLPHSTVFKPVQPYRRCIAETFKQFPEPAVRLMESLLSVDPAHRGTAASALKSEFFSVEPLACDPSSLPKYPPSKEIDAKRRDEEARREGAVGGRGQKLEPQRRGPRGSLDRDPIPAPNAHAQLVSSGQRGYQTSSKSRSEIYNSHKQQTNSGFLVDPSQLRQSVQKDSVEHQHKKVSYSGPLVHGTGRAKAGKEHDVPPAISARTNLSNLSGLVAARTSSAEVWQGKLSASQQETIKQVGRSRGSLNQLEFAGKEDRKCDMQKVTKSPQSGGGKFVDRESSLVHGPKGNKIYVSGPLLVQSNNVEQMLKEQDRQIQEFARRARVQRAKLQNSRHAIEGCSR